jgi:uncharacterized protein
MRKCAWLALFGAVVIGATLSAGAVTAAVADESPAKQSAFAAYSGYSPVLFPEQIKTSFYLPMRDGVKLAVNLYRPGIGGKAAEGRFPVVWHHTYERRDVANAASNAPYAAPDLTRFGYVVAFVERRGSGASFGVRRGYNDRIEAQDAYEVNEWLARQPWSTGKVGIVGCSNTGAAAMHTITMRPPHLLAAFVGCFTWDTYDWTLRGGIFAQWGTGVQRTVDEDMKSEPVEGDESKTLLLQAAQEHQQSTNLAAMWRGIPYRDDTSPLTLSRFWSEGSIASYSDQLHQSGVVLYILGGWRDDLRKDAFVTFNNWTPGKRHIVIGPWTHCRNEGLDLFAEMHRFFDFYLKDTPNGFEDDALIHYFTVNAPAGHEWHTATVWPLPQAKSTPFHLATKSRLMAAASGGASSFRVQYAVKCAAGFDAKLQWGPYAQPCPVEAGPHFLSPVLKQDTEITGHPIADIWISADVADVNLFVYLEDVAPDGSVTSITDGRQRASLRKVVPAPWEYMGLPWRRSNREDVQPLIPGTPARVQFDMLPVSYIVKAGHRIRVSVTGADYRERDLKALDPAPNITVHDTKDKPSQVLLPIVPGA